MENDVHLFDRKVQKSRRESRSICDESTRIP